MVVEFYILLEQFAKSDTNETNEGSWVRKTGCFLPCISHANQRRNAFRSSSIILSHLVCWLCACNENGSEKGQLPAPLTAQTPTYKMHSFGDYECNCAESASLFLSLSLTFNNNKLSEATHSNWLATLWCSLNRNGAANMQHSKGGILLCLSLSPLSIFPLSNDDDDSLVRSRRSRLLNCRLRSPEEIRNPMWRGRGWVA